MTRRIEARIGELLAETVEHGGDRRSSSHRESLKLRDLGITYSASSRWQAMARVPEDDRARYFAEVFAAAQDRARHAIARRLARGDGCAR